MLNTKETDPLIQDNYVSKELFKKINIIFLYSFCSFVMTIGNKFLVSEFRVPLILSFIQVVGAILIILLPTFFREIKFETWYDVWRWSRSMSTTFLLILVSNMFAMKHISLGMQIMLRNLNPIITVMFEKWFFKYSINFYSLIALLSIVPGTISYAKGNFSYNYTGVFWISVNIISTSAQRIIQKMLLCEKNGVKMSKMSMTFFNNLFSSLFLIPLIYFYEYSYAFKTNIFDESNWSYTMIILMFLTSVVGFFIGYVGISAQEIMSPSSMLVLVNSNKFLTILFAIYFMNENNSNKSIVGCILSLFSTCLYGYTQTNDYAPNKKNIYLSIFILTLYFIISIYY